jgi:hypothetical protein
MTLACLCGGRTLRVPVFAAATLAATVASAQTIPSEPVTFAGGRVVLGGDVAAGIAPEDTGFFNYSDYEQTTLRQFRLGMTGLVRVSDRISVLGELRSENFDYITPFALYARIRPLPEYRLDVQIGRIPPTFGGFSRRTYSHDNPLIGYPLAYQYLTSLRADSAPADGEELLRMRGRGWLSSFSVGDQNPARGVPLASAFTWDTGVQVSTGWRSVTAAVALTNGTPSNPRVSDDNGGKQIAARVTATPLTGLTVGGSYARGEFLDRHVRPLIVGGNSHDYDQRATELDVEYSRDHWLARVETVISEWGIPIAAMSGDPVPLKAVGTYVEGRYTFAPGWYGAARVDHVGFSRITTPTRTDEWEAPVSRVEVGLGYHVQRNLIARMSLQINRRDGGRVTKSYLPAVQFLYWF